MGRLLFTFTDSISKKKSKKKARHENLPIQALAFVFMVAAAFAYGSIVGYDYNVGTNGLASRKAYHNARMLETADVSGTCTVEATTVKKSNSSNTTSDTSSDASLDIESSADYFG